MQLPLAGEFVEKMLSLKKDDKKKYKEKYIKVHTATRWTIRHSLILHWFADLMNVTEEVTNHRPNVSTLLSSAFIRGDLLLLLLRLHSLNLQTSVASNYVTKKNVENVVKDGW